MVLALYSYDIAIDNKPVRATLEKEMRMATDIFMAGDLVKILRKPNDDEPSIWVPKMDPLVGHQGFIEELVDYSSSPANSPSSSGISIVHCRIHIPDIKPREDYWFPFYCLESIKIISTSVCACKIELLMARGCRCGAFAKEIK